jgi:hypothetical protein
LAGRNSQARGCAAASRSSGEAKSLTGSDTAGRAAASAGSRAASSRSLERSSAALVVRSSIDRQQVDRALEACRRGQTLRSIGPSLHHGRASSRKRGNARGLGRRRPSSGSGSSEESGRKLRAMSADRAIGSEPLGTEGRRGLDSLPGSTVEEEEASDMSRRR